MPWVWQENPKEVNRYLANRMDPVGWIIALGDFLDEEISLVEVALLMKEVQYVHYYHLLLSLREELTRVTEYQRGKNIQQPDQPCALCGRRCACASGSLRVATAVACAGGSGVQGEVRADRNDPVIDVRSGTESDHDEVGVPYEGAIGDILDPDEGEPQPG
jgi:hypothetical protein